MLTFDCEKRVSALEALRHPYLKDFYKEEDVKVCQQPIQMELDDGVQLSP